MVTGVDADRLHRLMLGLGADGYKKLESSVVSIVFDSEIGKYFALPFVASGIPVKLISASETSASEQLIDVQLSQKHRSHAYAQALRDFTGRPSLESIVGAEAELGFYGSTQVLNGSRVVIDCTNSQPSKSASLDFATKTQAAFISVSVVPGYARLEVGSPGKAAQPSVLMPGMAEMEESLVAKIQADASLMRGALVTKEMMGMFMAGIAADEAVRVILGKGEPPAKPLYLKFGYGQDVFAPKTKEQELRFLNPELFRENSALLFGAGAVGANVAFWLPKMGMGRVDVLDYDVIELTNLMRTLFYHKHVGELKAKVASEKIRELSGQATRSDFLNSRLTEDWAPESAYSVYVDGFDNFYSRNLVHKLAMAAEVPLLSASGRFDGFDMELYVPGKTQCFNCNFGLDRLAEKEEADRRNNCAVEFTPQNTWINQSVGALASLLIASALHPAHYGTVPNGMVMFDPGHDSRLLINSKAGVCVAENGAMQHGK